MANLFEKYDADSETTIAANINARIAKHFEEVDE